MVNHYYNNPKGRCSAPPFFNTKKFDNKQVIAMINLELKYFHISIFGV